jgi:predicted metal-binding membrane protein
VSTTRHSYQALVIHGRSGPASARTLATAAALATLGLAATCWILSIWQMNGMGRQTNGMGQQINGMGQQMDGMSMRGVAGLGSLSFFVGLWVLMMAAMMLPGSTPAIWRHVYANGRAVSFPLFLGAYLAVWTVVGIATYGLYRPHGTVATGVLVVAAGIYELTPLKQHFRRRCQESAGSGLGLGFCCVGSTIGLMVMLVALDVMSVTWMAMIAALVIAQKLVPARPAIDVPVGLAIVGLGVLVILAPSAVPGLTPSM